MKILYSIQATGNGHISRAMELLPYLQQYGIVDIFLSGANSTLPLNAPVKYRSNGISLFYTCNGSLSYSKLLRQMRPQKILKEIKDLPVEKYDFIINDFECITALACARKKIPSVHFGHQASFKSEKTPRPEKKSRLGEWILKNYARASQYIGLHFQNYDRDIFSPIIKKNILEAEPQNQDYITVYLPAYCDEQLHNCLKKIHNIHFIIFSHEVKTTIRKANTTFHPVNKDSFNKSLINCTGLLTGGGFETPAEALFLKKKLLVVPISGQYEQQCNAAALKQLGVPVVKQLNNDFYSDFEEWINDKYIPEVRFPNTTEMIINELMASYKQIDRTPDPIFPEVMFY